jgi:hypothetical protein
VLEGFGQPARACGPGAQVGSAIFRRWHGFPHWRSGGVLHLSATGVLTTATSDGAMQRAIRSVVQRVRLRRIACTRNTDATSWRLYWRSGRLRAGALASTPGGRYSRPSRKDNPTCRPPPNGRLCLPATTLLILLVTPDRERVVSRPEDGAPRWRTGQRYAYAHPVC